MITSPEKEILARAKRAIAKVSFTSKCLACGKSHTKTGAWLDRHKFKTLCCDAEFDPVPFRELAKSAIETRQAEIKTLLKFFDIKNSTKG